MPLSKKPLRKRSPVLVAMCAALMFNGVQARPTLIEGAHVFDGTRDIGKVSLLLEDGRITRVISVADSDARAAVPDDVHRVDYSNRFIIPGLVSDHSHVGNTDGTQHGDRYYTRANVLRNLRQFQAYGVTTVTALGMNGPAFSDIRVEVAADPTLGAQLFGSGAGVGAPDGAPPAAAMGLVRNAVPRPADADAARTVVREQAMQGVDIVKLWVDDLGGKAPQMSPEVYKAAIDEAHRLDLRVAAHVHDLTAAAGLVESGVDVIAHGVRDRPVDRALVDAMVRAGTWYVPTVNIDESNYVYAEHPEWLTTPFLRNALQAPLLAQFADVDWRKQRLAGDNIDSAKAAVAMNLRNLRTLHEAGVRIGFGTDSGAMPHRVIGFAEHRELELATQAGISARQALTIATRDAAKLLGLDDRGTLAAGMRADFVVLEANPLQEIGNTRGILAVWQAGQQVAGPVAKYSADRTTSTN